MSIHSRIRERRLALGLESHSALAKLVGVSWQTVQLWEKEEGGTAPNRNRIDKVAQVLGVTKEWLIGGDVTMEHLSPDEKKLLSAFRTMNSDEKQVILRLIARYAEIDHSKVESISAVSNGDNRVKAKKK